jgi:hypothetical protein
MISEEQIVEQLPYVSSCLYVLLHIFLCVYRVRSEPIHQIFELCEANAIPATFFEVTTALAFRFFDSERCEAVRVLSDRGVRAWTRGLNFCLRSSHYLLDMRVMITQHRLC